MKYDEVSKAARDLYDVIKQLKHEVETPFSPLNRDEALWDRQLAPIIRDCDSTLWKLKRILPIDTVRIPPPTGLDKIFGQTSMPIGGYDTGILAAILSELISQKRA